MGKAVPPQGGRTVKKMLLDAASRLRFQLRTSKWNVSIDLAVPAVLAAYLLAEWLSR